MRATSKKSMSKHREEHRITEQESPSGRDIAYDHQRQGHGLRAEFEPFGSHLADVDLERYHLGKVIVPAEQEVLEQHLLTCPECVSRAEECATYVDAMRGAVQTIEPWGTRQNVLILAVGRSLSAIN
jgi:hypothetical protein